MNLFKTEVKTLLDLSMDWYCFIRSISTWDYNNYIKMKKKCLLIKKNMMANKIGMNEDKAIWLKRLISK